MEKPAVQAKALGLIFPSDGTTPRVLNVPDALFVLAENRLMTTVEKRFYGIKRALKSLRDEEFDAVMIAHEERIMAWMARQSKADK